MTDTLVITHHLFLFSDTHSCFSFSFSADRLVQCPICSCEFVVGVIIGS